MEAPTILDGFEHDVCSLGSLPLADTLENTLRRPEQLRRTHEPISCFPRIVSVHLRKHSIQLVSRDPVVLVRIELLKRTVHPLQRVVLVRAHQPELVTPLTLAPRLRPSPEIFRMPAE